MPIPADVLPRPLPARSLAARAAATLALGLLITSAACLDDPAVAPRDGAVRLGIRAQVAPGPGEHAIAIRVYYFRQNEQQVDLPVTPAVVNVPRGGTSTQAISVQITECLADPQRAMGESESGCLLFVELRLLDSGGGFISGQTHEVEASTPGQEVPVDPFDLPRASIALSATSVTFEALDHDESLPPASTIFVSSATGASLGEVTAEVIYPEAEEMPEWLSSSLVEGQLTLRPSTTSLFPGTYSATVDISSSREGVESAEVEVTYIVTGRPRSISIHGEGSGSATIVSTPEGIDCTILFGQTSGGCSASFPFGTEVTLTLSRTHSSVFGGWSGSCPGTGPCTVTVDHDAQITAHLSPPVAGGDLVIFGDVNPFDTTALKSPSNIRMVENLVGYTAEGPRATGRTVLIECGRGNTQTTLLCGSHWTEFNRRLAAIDYNSTFSNSAPGSSLKAIPAGVKVIVFALSCQQFTTDEINVLKEFAAQGGRVVSIGEHSGVFAAQCGLVQNQLASALGANVTYAPATLDCGYNTLPGSVLRSHQITSGMTQIVVACSSAIMLGAGAQPLYFSVEDGARVLTAVAPIDTRPIETVPPIIARDLRSVPAVPALLGAASLIGH